MIRQQRNISDLEVREDGEAWRKIRNETIPRLKHLEDKLRLALKKVKVARTVRNITVVASILVGLFFPPLTRVASVVLAAAVIGGTTCLVSFIEMYIARDALKTKQEDMERDKEETNRLRRRILSYQSGNDGTDNLRTELNNLGPGLLFFLRDLNKLTLIFLLCPILRPLGDFLATKATTTNFSLLDAIRTVTSYREKLDKQLRQVEEVEGQFI